MSVSGEKLFKNKFFKILFDFCAFEKYFDFSYMCELREVPNFIEVLFILEIFNILLHVEVQSIFDKTPGIIRAGIFPVTKSSYDYVLSKI